MNFPVRMLHEHYGATHAYNRHELEKLQKSGWVIEGAAVMRVVDPFEEAPRVVELEKRRGRPPKMKE